MKTKLNVLMMVDLPFEANVEDYASLLKGEEWQTEIDIHKALINLGHNIRIVGVYDSIEPLIKEVEAHRPDVVFNLVEHYNNNTSLERSVVAFLELLGLPYTGSGPTCLSLCKNKNLMKKLMAYHKIKSPHFDVIKNGQTITKPKHLSYPILIKPNKEDASYGISQASFVENDDAFVERVKFLHESMSQDALVEEYIEGRELYVSILGNDRLSIYSPREVVFKQVPDDEPKIATFKAKWDVAYRKKWGIRNQFANPLPDGVLDKINKVCKRVYRNLLLLGYGRIDLRLTPENEIMVLEANPNPGISQEEELPQSVMKDGMSYDELIQRILQLGLQSFKKENR